MTKTLLLMRHAATEDTRPGEHDQARRLTAAGRTQAKALGDWLRSEQRVDLALCSTALRARQTLEACGLGDRAEFDETLYNAGSDTILEAVHALPERVQTALVVGHAPGIPGLVHDLSDAETSDAHARSAIDSRFPAGTVAVLTFDGGWAELTSGTLVGVRLPTDQ